MTLQAESTILMISMIPYKTEPYLKKPQAFKHPRTGKYCPITQRLEAWYSFMDPYICPAALQCPSGLTTSLPVPFANSTLANHICFKRFCSSFRTVSYFNRNVAKLPDLHPPGSD